MIVRRVVTGHDPAGRSVVVSDQPNPRSKKFEHTPGFTSNLVWLIDETPSLPTGTSDPTTGAKTILPPPGGTAWHVITFPPDSVMVQPGFDFAAAGAEHLRESPGIADKFEPDHPGMHTTDSVDYAVVLAGAIWLELDDGKTVHLKQHDTIVQQGTRHAWRNKGSAPATLAVVLVGANRPTSQAPQTRPERQGLDALTSGSHLHAASGPILTTSGMSAMTASGYRDFAKLIGRILLVSLFVMAACDKYVGFDGTGKNMDAAGVPGIWLPASIALDVIGAAFIAVGYQTRIVALLLALYTLALSFLFHFQPADHIQMLLFIKNVGLVGAFICLSGAGAEQYSVDAQTRGAAVA